MDADAPGLGNAVGLSAWAAVLGGKSGGEAAGAGAALPVNSKARPAPQAGKRSSAKSRVRPGFNLMSWNQLRLDDVRRGQHLRLIDMEEVRQHRTAGDAWSVFRGRVYDVSAYFPYHPGGEQVLLSVMGKDCTTLFEQHHRWVHGAALLEKCLLGVLRVRPQPCRAPHHSACVPSSRAGHLSPPPIHARARS